MLDHLDAIRRESDTFYATAEKADPELNVPSCPDWNVADLVWHLAEVHWFWATDIDLRASDPDEIEKDKPERPRKYSELLAFGRSQVDHLISVLEATPDDIALWTWASNESDHTVGFIRRHQVQEAAVHRWDMQTAATHEPPDPIDPDAAVDSIDEFFSISLPWCVNEKKPLPGTVHLHCTDTAGEWFIHGDGRVEALHAKGDVALRGTASDLLLALYSRVPLEALDVIGDAALAAQFVGKLNLG